MIPTDRLPRSKAHKGADLAGFIVRGRERTVREAKTATLLNRRRHGLTLRPSEAPPRGVSPAHGPFDLHAFPPRVGPSERQGADLPTRSRMYQVVETLHDHAPLQRAVERHAEVMSHHERQEHGAWRLGVFGHVSRYGGRDGGDSSAFDGALHERDALMADGSGRRGKDDVGAFGPHGGGDVLRERPLQSLRVHVVADEGVEGIRQPAYHPFGR